MPFNFAIGPEHKKPSRRSEQAHTLRCALDDWFSDAREIVDEIGGRRNHLNESQFSYDWNEPERFLPNAYYLYSQLPAILPDEDFSPIKRISVAVERWFHNGGPSQVPPQSQLEVDLHQAVFIVNRARVKLSAIQEEERLKDAKPNPDTLRVRCEDETRSVYLDGKLVAAQIQPTPFSFFKCIAEGKGAIVAAKVIQKLPGLNRDKLHRVKEQLPEQLRNWISSQSGARGGYFLTLPAAKTRP